MPETVVGNVLVAQLCSEAVPDTWRGSSKAPARHDLSVDERSRRRRPCQTKSMSSARYAGAWPDKDAKTKHASLKSTRLWTGGSQWDVVDSSSSSEKPSGSILDRLNFADRAVRNL